MTASGSTEAREEDAAPPQSRLVLERIVVSDLRNLQRVDVALSPRVTVVSGLNGQGKTSLIEAIYLAATSKSFRTTKLAEIVRHGAGTGFVRARFHESAFPASPREQVVVLEHGKRTVKIDGKRPPSLAAFAVRSPVVCFHPGELELSSGPAMHRRTLLDRVALFVDPVSADHHARYREALRARQKALELRGENAPDVPPFEAIAATHGAKLTEARARAAASLAPELAASFARLAAPGLALSARYEPGGSTDPAVFAAELAQRRARDRMRGLATYGPQRDDLALSLDGHPARSVGSQGQHRALTLALKLAELAAVARARGVFPVLLLDDVSSELDRDRTLSLLSVLAETRGQVVITTTRPEMIDTRGLVDRFDVEMASGRVRAPSSEFPA